MDEVERKLRIFAKEIDSLRGEIDYLKREMSTLKLYINYISFLNIGISEMIYGLSLVVASIVAKSSLSTLALSLKYLFDKFENYSALTKDLPEDARKALKHSIEAWNTMSSSLIRQGIILYFLEAISKKVSFEKALHVLRDVFEGWSFLKYISDNIILETYGTNALNVLEKYKKTFIKT